MLASPEESGMGDSAGQESSMDSNGPLERCSMRCAPCAVENACARRSGADLGRALRNKRGMRSMFGVLGMCAGTEVIGETVCSAGNAVVGGFWASIGGLRHKIVDLESLDDDFIVNMCVDGRWRIVAGDINAFGM